MSTDDWSDIADPTWAERLRRGFEQAHNTSVAGMTLTDNLLASNERIDEIAAKLDEIEDPEERRRAEIWIEQARLNNTLGETDNHLLEQIAMLQEAVLVLADGLRRMQLELRESRGG